MTKVARLAARVESDAGSRAVTLHRYEVFDSRSNGVWNTVSSSCVTTVAFCVATLRMDRSNNHGPGGAATRSARHTNVGRRVSMVVPAGALGLSNSSHGA